MILIRNTVFLAALGSIGLVLAGCQTQSTSSLDNWSSKMTYRAPSKNKIHICHAFGCKLKQGFTPTKKDLKKINTILKKGRSSPQAERKAMGKMVQWFEKRVGPAVGSNEDKGGLDMWNSGVAGQMDCIDEASNTTSYLLFAQKHGFLTHHSVRAPVARGFFLDGRYPHATAVVKETESGRDYAIDSWVHDNGVLPEIKPLEVWFKESPSSRNRS